MKTSRTASYNERLFAGGFRTSLHLARYRWFATSMRRLEVVPETVLELGCFDGKLINFLPSFPKRYVGFDANWENGLSLAREQWRGHPNLSFITCNAPDEMQISESELFDVSVIMETFEHMPPEMVGAYMERITRHTSKYVFVTVPNEKGLLFLAKWFFKRLILRAGDAYTLKEVWLATLGRLERAVPADHKGFDYQKLISELSRHMDILEVSGLPFTAFPVWLGFTIGIVGRPKLRVDPARGGHVPNSQNTVSK